MKIDSIQLIKDLSNASGISGFEDDVLDVARKYMKDMASVEEDKIRNLYFHRKENTGNRPVVMIDGHSDELGFMIQSIQPNGALKFLPVGGWQPQAVMGHKVRVRNMKGNYITGIVAAKPPHFMRPEERDQLVKIEDMIIDVGATSKDDAVNNFRIEAGAPAVPDVRFQYDEENDLMVGKAFDCRIGCAAVIETIMRLDGESIPVDVVGTLSSQEEVGLRGARVSSRKTEPDVAIIFEGTPADDLFKDEHAAQGRMKFGPQIRHIDRSMISNPRFVKFARDIAKKMGIKFQDAVRRSGGTNGSAVNLSGHGIPTIVIGIPVRYIHSHYGFAATEDYSGAVEWCCQIIKQLDLTAIDGF